MAAKYKLTYYDAKGLGEPIRYLLAYGGAEFEEVRFTQEDWPRLKPGTPFGKVPVLEVDGKPAHQSAAICRYLGRKFKLAGDGEWEALQIDATADTIVDLRVDIVNCAFATGDQKQEKKDKLEKETLPDVLSRLDQQVKDNRGYFVGGKLSYADVVFAALSEFLAGLLQREDLSEGYPHLQELVRKVNALPKIEAWRARRPVTQY